MSRMKDYLDEWEFGHFNDEGVPLCPDDYWMTNRGRVVPIDKLDFQHLENIVNYFSQEGTTVAPDRQGAFEKVMLRYLRLQAEINEVHKDIL